ncbi:phosphoribosyl-dephospho-CoA transferase MdcG domain-containing protein, partial [uncultured Salinisphaera sp.]|uniref:phosphoribosyl-dephospho-CoA transferase MdcG domain-containing protein n=1 Tax=uncultured Salinisphaera sp. TaxID=359372 RepID=UPI0032B13E6D
AFDPRDLSVLVAAAKTSMYALRGSDGEASAAALGRASEGMLGLDAHVAMRRTLRAMTETARRAVHGVHPAVPAVPAEGDRTEGAHSGDDAPTLRPVGAIFTHIVPGETSVTSVAQSTPIDAHGYWSPHVDKANVPEYDVSAVLYLSDGDGVVSVDDVARPPRSERGGDVPALAALADIRHRLKGLSIVWGPTGAVGYELATGRAVAHRESDLDLVVRLPECCNDVLAALCEMAAAARQTYAIRCDIQLETPAGGVALADWAGEAGQMMVKSDTGPYLTANPWAVAA